MTSDIKKSNDDRTRQLAKIHLAKKTLGLDDETYRDMLWTVARVRSASELDAPGRMAVIQHLVARGFVAKSGKKHRKDRPKNMAGSRGNQLKKIEAILADAKREWAYADGIARNMFGVAKVAWCNEEQLHKLIGAMMVDQSRRKKRELAKEDI